MVEYDECNQVYWWLNGHNTTQNTAQKYVVQYIKVGISLYQSIRRNL